MKKNLMLVVVCLLVMSLLAGCMGTIVVVERPAEETQPVLEEGALKTGLAVITSVGKSASVSDEAEGAAEFTRIAVIKDSNAFSFMNSTYDNDLVFVIGAKTEYKSYNSAKYPDEESAPYAGQNSLNTETVTIDGVECPQVYLPEHDASAIIEIDNIAVWVGGGEMPEHTDTSVYAALVATPAPAPAE